MRTQDFIGRHAQHMRNGGSCRGASCSSVFCDGEKVYSYGYHYPLLYPVSNRRGERLLVLNNRGYSVTTARHIHWASRYSDIAVESSHVIANTEDIIAQIETEIGGLREQLANLKRKGTKKELVMRSDIARKEGYLSRMQEV